MQIIVILMTIVGLLTMLSGVIVLFGSPKADRVRSMWYAAAAVFATVWIYSMAAFVSAQPGASMQSIYLHLSMAFACAIMLDAAFLGYSAWNKKYGKPATLIAVAVAAVIGVTVLVNPNLMYDNVVISPSGNTVSFVMGPLAISYVAFFCVVVPLIMLTFLQQHLRARSQRNRSSGLVVMVVYGVSSMVVAITNLLMPMLGNCRLLWLGPIVLGATILAVYYTILRYRMINLSHAWLRFFSYIVVVTSIAIVYIAIFAVVFAALFRGSTPSIEVIILNFIMILIFIALMPAMSSLNKITNSLIADHPHKHAEDGQAETAAGKSEDVKPAEKEPKRHV